MRPRSSGSAFADDEALRRPGLGAADRSRVDRRSRVRRHGGASARGSASPKAHRVCSTEHSVGSAAMLSSQRYPHPVSTNAKVDFETLLDKQDSGTALSADEQAAAPCRTGSRSPSGPGIAWSYRPSLVTECTSEQILVRPHRVVPSAVMAAASSDSHGRATPPSVGNTLR